MDMQAKKDLQKFAVSIRKETMRAIGTLGVGHVGGALSICDVLAVLYGGEMNIDPADPHKEDRDWLVCSKGHAGPAVYATLALKGFFPKEELLTLNKPGTNLPSHCDMNRTPGIDMTTGSLGQGTQEACMLMDVSPGKMLQLRRSRSIPYSYIDRKVYYKRQDIIRFMENNIHQVIQKIQ